MPTTRRVGVTAELRKKVIQRDIYQAWTRTDPDGLSTWNLELMLMGWEGAYICAAHFLDPRESATCSGRTTLDHVKTEPRMGKRAEDDEQHLVSLCEYHHLETQAGRNWATANRPLLRQYLKEIYDE